MASAHAAVRHTDHLHIDDEAVLDVVLLQALHGGVDVINLQAGLVIGNGGISHGADAKAEWANAGAVCPRVHGRLFVILQHTGLIIPSRAYMHDKSLHALPNNPPGCARSGRRCRARHRSPASPVTGSSTLQYRALPLVSTTIMASYAQQAQRHSAPCQAVHRRAERLSCCPSHARSPTAPQSLAPRLPPPLSAPLDRPVSP